MITLKRVINTIECVMRTWGELNFIKQSNDNIRVNCDYIRVNYDQPRLSYGYIRKNVLDEKPKIVH